VLGGHQRAVAGWQLSLCLAIGVNAGKKGSSFGIGLLLLLHL